MSELILTDDEKCEGASFLDWDDASVGRAMKDGMLAFRDARRRSGGRASLQFAAYFVLAHDCEESNAAEGRMVLRGVTKDGKPIGDWCITVRRHEGVRARVRDWWERVKARLFPRDTLDLHAKMDASGRIATADIAWRGQDGRDRTHELEGE